MNYVPSKNSPVTPDQLEPVLEAWRAFFALHPGTAADLKRVLSQTGAVGWKNGMNVAREAISEVLDGSATPQVMATDAA